MKIIELTEHALNWAVAKCEGLECTEDMGLLVVEGVDGYYVPSMKWAQGGPIIEREKIAIEWTGEGWSAYIRHADALPAVWILFDDDTPLIAAMRCYVASKLGGEVEIPKELT